MASQLTFNIQVMEISGLTGDLYCELRFKNNSYFERTATVKKSKNPSWAGVIHNFTAGPNDEYLFVKVYNKVIVGKDHIVGVVQISVQSLKQQPHNDLLLQLFSDVFCKKPGHGQIRIIIDHNAPNSALPYTFVAPLSAPVSVPLNSPVTAPLNAPVSVPDHGMPKIGTPLTVTVFEVKMNKPSITCTVSMKDVFVYPKLLSAVKTQQGIGSWTSDNWVQFIPSNPDQNVIVFEVFFSKIFWRF